MIKSFAKKLKTDAIYKQKFTLYLTIIFNMVYSIFLYVTCCIYRSTWFFVLSVYYALLCVARILVFKQTPSKSKLRSKILTMRTCGCFLLAINIIFSIMSFILINETPISKYHEIIVISLATYTFFLLGDAIVGSVKIIKINNHVFLSAKLISLTSASVSLLSLTNTMLVTWGKENVALRSIILPLLCAGISIFIIVCAILMIRKSILDLRKINNDEI